MSHMYEAARQQPNQINVEFVKSSWPCLRALKALQSECLGMQCSRREEGIVELGNLELPYADQCTLQGLLSVHKLGFSSMASTPRFVLRRCIIGLCRLAAPT